VRSSGTSWRQPCLLNRRDFCKTASWAALGILSANTISGIACKGRAADPLRAGDPDRKESGMANEILAVEAKVLSQKGSCALGHKVGDVVKFTEYGVEGKICIHVLYSMLPAVFAMLFDARFPWLNNPDVKTHACPDAFNPVVFEISRIRKT
jgi:uncharacterized repeat protein (TIGR04076 family)